MAPQAARLRRIALRRPCPQRQQSNARRMCDARWFGGDLAWGQEEHGIWARGLLVGKRKTPAAAFSDAMRTARRQIFHFRKKILACRGGFHLVCPPRKRGRSSVGRASRCQRECREFESLRPLSPFQKGPLESLGMGCGVQCGGKVRSLGSRRGRSIPARCKTFAASVFRCACGPHRGYVRPCQIAPHRGSSSPRIPNPSSRRRRARCWTKRAGA